MKLIPKFHDHAAYLRGQKHEPYTAPDGLQYVDLDTPFGTRTIREVVTALEEKYGITAAIMVRRGNGGSLPIIRYEGEFDKLSKMCVEEFGMNSKQMNKAFSLNSRV